MQACVCMHSAAGAHHTHVYVRCQQHLGEARAGRRRTDATNRADERQAVLQLHRPGARRRGRDCCSASLRPRRSALPTSVNVAASHEMQARVWLIPLEQSSHVGWTSHSHGDGREGKNPARARLPARLLPWRERPWRSDLGKQQRAHATTHAGDHANHVDKHTRGTCNCQRTISHVSRRATQAGEHVNPQAHRCAQLTPARNHA